MQMWDSKNIILLSGHEARIIRDSCPSGYGRISTEQKDDAQVVARVIVQQPVIDC